VKFNDVVIADLTGTTEPILLEEVFTAASVNAVAGPNVVTIERPSGDSQDDGGNSGWIQFDFLSAELRAAPSAELQIIDIDYDAILGDFSVTWTSEADKSYAVDTSADLETWEVALPDVPSGGDTTTATVSPPAGAVRFYLRVREL
jgi:hypothetical protein